MSHENLPSGGGKDKPGSYGILEDIKKRILRDFKSCHTKHLKLKTRHGFLSQYLRFLCTCAIHMPVISLK